MAQPLQRRRHQEPAKLPWLATRPRSLGPTTRPAKLDRRRYRKRTIPTDNAIRAILFVWLGRINRGPASGTATQNASWSNKRIQEQPISSSLSRDLARVQRSALSDGGRKADFHCPQPLQPTRHQGVH